MNECRIIEDLLPLYTDGLLQEDTNEFVKLHLVHCSACSEKEKQLSAKIEIPPPAAEGNRFRRVGKKLRLKAFLISAISLILATGIFLAAYLPYHRRKMELLAEQYEKENILQLIQGLAERQSKERREEWTISQGNGEGVRVRSGNFVLHLPEGFRRVEEGYFVRNRTFPYVDYEEVTDYVWFYESENQYFVPEHTLSDPAKIKCFERGWALLEELGLWRSMELANYYYEFDFDSLTMDSSEDELAIGLCLVECYNKLFIGSSHHRITGRVSGYCFRTAPNGWMIYLENPKDAESCYSISLFDYDMLGPVYNPFEINEEMIFTLLSGVEIL